MARRFVVNMATLRIRGGRQLGLGVLRGLAEIEPASRMLILAPEGAGYEDVPLPSRFDLETVERPRSVFRRLALDEKLVPALAAKYGADAVLHLTNSGPSRPGVPQVLALLQPQFHTRERSALRLYTAKERALLAVSRRMFGRALRRASFLVTLTEAGADAVAAQYRYPRDRILVIPNSTDLDRLDRSPADSPCAERIRSTEAIRCLLVCGYYSHKNFEVVAPAMRRLARRSGRPAVCFLTFDPARPAAAAFLRRVRRQGLSDHLRVIHPVPDEELGAVYRSGDVFVFPTVNEAWSATYLDAMYCGIPMATSDRPFARALCDDAALYFDPFDPDDIAAKLERAVGDEEERARLIARGRRRAREIHRSWSWIAGEYVRVLEEAARERSRSGGSGREA